MAAFDNAFLGQVSKRMAGGHEADAVNARELSFRVNNVAGFQLPGVDPLADSVLNPLVCRLFLARIHCQDC